MTYSADSPTTDSPTALDEIPGGPYDIEFFFDPGCPFAWQTSVWIRRVADLRGVKVGWRFISLSIINEHTDVSDEYRRSHERGKRYHRICAAARERHGNDAVGALYKAYGDRYWYTSDADLGDVDESTDRRAAAAAKLDFGEILAALDLPADLAAEADNDVWDKVLRAESDEAFARTGPNVGTPIITYDPPTGNSLFGPVISDVPDDDDTSVAFYDALRTFVDFPYFSELKRTTRAPLNLPLLKG